MKIKFPMFFYSICFVFLAAFFLPSSSHAGDICFCHMFRQTICTSDPGQQNGHTNHGDPNFGCICGDGVCDPEDGETEETCPQDCGVPIDCGDDMIDEGEECGEPGLPQCLPEQQCEGCRCTPPILCVSDDECPDDGNPCNGEELCVPVMGCVSDGIVDCGPGEVCVPNQGCVASSALSGSGDCSLNSTDSKNFPSAWIIALAAALSAGLLWRGFRNRRAHS